MPVSGETPGPAKRFVYIDALRGIAALYVLIFHFHGQIAVGSNTRYVPDFVRAFFHHGDLGVQIFFVLSGFVISFSVHHAWVTPKFLARFALRRSVRLDPPYWLLIALNYLILSRRGPLGAAKGIDEWQVLLANGFYLDNLMQYPSVVKVGWTLCFEIQFYLTYVILFGAMQYAAKHLRTGHWTRVAVFLPITGWSLAIAAGFAVVPLPGLSLGAWCLFFAGVMTFWAVAGVVHYGWTAAYLVALISTVLWRWDPGALVAAGTALSILAVHRFGDLKSALGARPLQYLGRISYSLYLIHPTVGTRLIRVLKRVAGPEPGPLVEVGMFVVATAASLIAAHVLWRLLERPAQQLSKRVVMRSARNA